MFHEKPDKLLLSSIESFEIEPDLLTLRRIEEVINKTNQYRSNTIENYETKLNTMKSEFQSLMSEINLLTKVSGINYENLKLLGNGNEESMGDLSNKNIFNVMNEKSIELDNLKLSLAKNLNDLESQINSMNITKKDLMEKYELVKMKNDNLINDNILKNPDSKAIKINIYKNLGVEIESGEEGETENKQDKVIIYNKETNLSSILNIDDKYSEYFITNYIWDRLQGY
ncbi:DEHA2B04400p [Debaryomyces hansenii CBS767]|uniref:Probable kinetochore protein SPC24 n=1 Tax=Debaryomyces hansenii (strain ATCC 36239 / CBS 767 / BCRC 21394 / JCM 1990 / NBRC 0083 / IGC 2968) TaxID=284592 RepID=SPC24_DEBHA|nr:DEHA2B04400p [Debaryomyces hansenii CBS767]Q6BXB6.1 RecName: Full=Probable kinetochore protein SPC24 [Debaryomyces hansenii CBS767]CAG85147.1 DEHA2B04400p [Debaryomyces hansenii CBS767]|eukprot:XP_457153.1 DEHA2B04400p [Debaryomyces hansenii CBS767]